ncbi:MAG: ATP-dependent zinc metalloprotease FtsH [Mitsuokella jalaludinii]|uniref:ATP-dependent zinc metalloprotease FtsH n=3 Tax=Mitsuokella jalaludinii TaxID=187979 RepID=UPI001D01F063|nr:ATP-dependent zinc metalloprotease FtsH [Mitsuokella jalaludinii]MCB5724353.1 ATP-dependent zinc metalloprotease FtsH [Mitsuokella jalaludinii]MCI6610690.1 ATP-dependent zinc metalloprotease FtsH [Mitsuokella jalaludinii]MCI7064852.1 ATP-dependent zinc metalloprotease FtsH [Mitsuokella jalaludinii]MCI7716246.1 ATP-dependent zinc metalloprotease FtsH [Mitsuokella jalaludinii]MDY5364989.1 ATP-dependent zinc metalloprotease FtsH [Mitsuokella jalaludinii]
MNKFLRNVGFYLLIILVAISVIDYFSTKNTNRQEVEYTQFLQQVDKGDVSKVVIIQNTIHGTLADGTEFTTITPDAPNNDPDLYQKLSAKGIDIAAENPPEPPWWSQMFSSVIPILLLIGVWFFIMQQTQGGGGRVMSFGKSRARMSGADKIKVTFRDVAGADEAKQELEEVVEFLKHPKKFNELGARIPKGVLLFGPPGTGKTLLARAVAGEAGVPFFSISGSDFVEMFVGVGASRVRDLFEQAKKNAPCIVFIDEIDAVGRQRGAGVGGGHDEREQTLNQLLVEMDGFAANEGIIIIAATNRPDILDPALLRPGRFDRQIVVDKPDVRGRLAILKVHTKGKPMAKDVDLDIIARRTPGFTGADLSNLVNEAALLAARRDKHKVGMTEMEEAIERVIAGPERKSHVMSEEEKRLTAYHEGGHTLVGMMLKHADPVHKVTIIPRGRAGGYTLMLPKEDRNYATRSELLDRLKVAMGGRVAEEVVLKEISTGASQDIQQASRIVRSMIMQYGMSDVLGPVAYGESQNHQVFLGRDINHQRNYSEEVASEIDKEVRKYMEEAYEACRKIITENRDKLELIAQALMERETLTAKELEELLTTGSITDPDDKDEDDKPQSGTPAVTPLPVEQAEKPEAVAKETEKESEEEHEKEAEPKFNVTHYDK